MTVVSVISDPSSFWSLILFYSTDWSSCPPFLPLDLSWTTTAPAWPRVRWTPASGSATSRPRLVGLAIIPLEPVQVPVLGQLSEVRYSTRNLWKFQQTGYQSTKQCCGSGMVISGPNFFHPGLMIWVVHPGSRIQGSKRHRIPDPKHWYHW